ncbi:hypothetical protein GALL_528900 [mine drainage metagenome]|uniref:Uncharacterized protein n=1 Tax=mine drainage metagenome TaxID=410659 RepID=A0A1J5P322_9ZZZZ
METTETIELKFEGNGVKPSTIKASEVAELIRSFEASLLAVLKKDDPGFNDAIVYVSFEEIKDKCLLLRLKPHFIAIYAAATIISTSINEKSFDDYSITTIEDLRALTKFAKRHDCSGEILQDGKTLASFDKNTEISYSDKGTIWGETTIYGEVKRAGGDNPTTTIKINDDYKITFDVSKEVAIKLASNLYKEIGLIGRAKWNKKTYRILEFKASDVIILETEPITKTFDEISQLFTKEDFDNFDLIL